MQSCLATVRLLREPWAPVTTRSSRSSPARTDERKREHHLTEHTKGKNTNGGGLHTSFSSLLRSRVHLSVPSDPSCPPRVPSLYPAVPRRGPPPSLLPGPLPAVPVGLAATAGAPQRPPLVAREGGADGEVGEDGVPADEVHPERQVVGSHPLQLRGAGARAPLQLSDAPLFRRAWRGEEGGINS